MAYTDGPDLPERRSTHRGCPSVVTASWGSGHRGEREVLRGPCAGHPSHHQRDPLLFAWGIPVRARLSKTEFGLSPGRGKNFGPAWFHRGPHRIVDGAILSMDQIRRILSLSHPPRRRKRDDLIFGA